MGPFDHSDRSAVRRDPGRARHWLATSLAACASTCAPLWGCGAVGEGGEAAAIDEARALDSVEARWLAEARAAWQPPARPDGCASLAPGSDLRAALAALPAGGALCLDPGTYHGPVVIEGARTVWGPRAAVIRSDSASDAASEATSGAASGRSNAAGTTVRLRGQGPELLGLTVDGSGSRFDRQDAAVHVEAQQPRVEGVVIQNALFGLVVEKSREASIRGNRIRGTGKATLGLRGDAVRVWETTDSTIEGNVITASRDMVIWYASRNRILDNLVLNGRYGTHFMYSHDNRVEGNRYLGNVVGVFAMYSRDLTIRRNWMAGAAGAAGMGLGLKESSGLEVVENVFIDDTVGIHLDRSPYLTESPNHFERNILRLCETGIVFHSSPSHNRFVGNSLRGNTEQVRVDGSGDAQQVVWLGNDFGDYKGYDLDGDGVGDIPYELRRFSDALVARNPSLALFRGTPALWLVDLASHLLPLLEPRTILVDPAPRMASLDLEAILADRN